MNLTLKMREFRMGPSGTGGDSRSFIPKVKDGFWSVRETRMLVSEGRDIRRGLEGLKVERSVSRNSS